MTDLESAMAELTEARDRLADAKAAHERARNAVHEALERRAAERSAEGGIDAELARALYWEHPDVHVAKIGPACGIRPGEVHRYSGKHFKVTIPCRRCGEGIDKVLGSRTAVAQITGATPWELCGECFGTIRRINREWDAVDSEAWERDRAIEREWWARHVSPAALAEAERLGIQVQ